MTEEQEQKRAERIERIKTELGAYPNSPAHYAELAARKLHASVTYKGAMTMAGLSHASLLDLQRDARILAVELGIAYKPAQINDVIDRWALDQREAHLTAIRKTIAIRVDFDWHALVRECFDTSDMDADLIVAILRHTVWQVQRKLAGKPVIHHLMPVLYGAQGNGKTYWLERFVAPLRELTTHSDFQAIADERMIDLWRSSIIVLDEMAKAGKADVETVKHVITAATLDRRPMRTTSLVQVAQRATLIGASNHRLVEVIRDETGARRFVELVYRRPADPHYLDTIDWYAAWSSVQAEDECPILPYLDALKTAQADMRHTGPVEQWVASLTTATLVSLNREAGSDGLVSGEVLYDAYNEHRREVTPAYDREARTLNTFCNELRRVVEQRADCPIQRKRTKSRNAWKITAPLTMQVAA